MLTVLNNYMFLFQNASAQAALQAASALSGQNETQGGPNTVLRVIIEHMVYPVTLEVLCQVSGDSHVRAK
jgi:polypyrimidine tract-binding protein 2